MADKWEQYAEAPARAPSGEDKWAQFEEGRGTAGEPPVQSNGVYATLKKFLKGGYAPKEGDPGIELPFLKGSFQDTPRSQRQPIEPSIGNTLGYANDVSSTALIQGLKGLAGKGSLEKLWGAMSDRKQRKGAPEQLMEDWGKEGLGKWASYGVGIPLSILADPFGAMMSMRNPAAKNVLRPNESGNGVRVAQETELGARPGWNAVEGKLASTPIASPLRQQTAKAGQNAEKTLYENAFSDVNRVYGEKKGRRKDVPYFTDQVLEDGVFKPGMSVGQMHQAHSEQIRKTLGDQFNDIWAKHSDLRQNPEDALKHPEFVEWEKEARRTKMGSEMADDVINRIKGEAEYVNTDLLEEPQQFIDALSEGRITPDQYVKHTTQNPIDSSIPIPLRLDKVNPGANPDVATTMASEAAGVARGSKVPNYDVMKVKSKDNNYKQGEMAFSNAMRGQRDSLVGARDPKVLPKLKEANRKYSVYKDSEDAFNALMKTEKGRMGIPTLRSMAALLGHPWAAITGSAIKGAQHPVGAVRAGAWVKQAGESNVWDRALQQLLQERDK